jgi:ABC-type antimicrobial peptide transport system permease subunit
MNLVVRTAGDPMSFATPVRRAVAAVDADQPVHNLRPMRDFVAQSSATRRFNMQLLATFAALALTLAMVGLHGVMTFLVTQRTREIGVRLALGARPADVRRMILREGGWRVLAGCAAGVAGALALARLIQGHLFGVAATDPLTLAVVSLLLVGVAGAACWQAANRASRVNPMEALRGD